MKKKIISKSYYTDEAKNTCVCVLDFALIDNSQIECEAIDNYSKKCKSADKELYFLEDLDKEGKPTGQGILVRKFRVRGKAKCSPEDKFDPTVGTDIAEFRAEREMARIENDVLLKVLKTIHTLRVEYEKHYNKVSLFSEMRKSYIEDRSNPIEVEE